MLLVVWIAVAVVAVVVLGSVLYGVFGAAQRLGREAAALDRELRPVLAQVQATVQDPAAHAARPPAGLGPADQQPAIEQLENEKPADQRSAIQGTAIQEPAIQEPAIPEPQPPAA